MEMELCAPPGFRFYPTEEELVGYYLNRKINSLKIDVDVITELDLYRIEPWDIQDICKLGYEEQNGWYFFSHKDKKYPTGTRTNRATIAGFWKATGRDKAVLSKNKIIGMRKTLVFYEGRAPNGRKTDWIIHEYRLQTSKHGPPQEEGWVVCRAFKKQSPSHAQGFQMLNCSHHHGRDDDHVRYGSLANITSPVQISDHYKGANNCPQKSVCYEQELGSQINAHLDHKLIKLPQLHIPTLRSTALATRERFEPYGIISQEEDYDEERNNHGGEQLVDWKALDQLLASQLSETTSCPKNNFPSILQDYELDAHNSGNDLLGYFQNL